MKCSVTISELKMMSLTRREAYLAELMTATKTAPNGEIADLNERIRAFEEKHGMDSHKLREKLDKGEIRETVDVCKWLMLLTIRDRLVSPHVPLPQHP